MTINLAPGERDPSRIVQAVRELAQGRDNASGVVTLTTSSATTTVSAPNCSALSQVFLQETTTSAAVERASGSCFVNIPPFEGGFVISHTNSTNTSRIFHWTTRG